MFLRCFKAWLADFNVGEDVEWVGFLPFFVVDPGLESLVCSCARIRVIHTSSNREEQKCRIAFNFELFTKRRAKFAGAVDSCNVDAILVLHMEKVPNGIQFLAVGTPRGIKLNEPGQALTFVQVESVVEVGDI